MSYGYYSQRQSSCGCLVGFLIIGCYLLYKFIEINIIPIMFLILVCCVIMVFIHNSRVEKSKKEQKSRDFATRHPVEYNNYSKILRLANGKSQYASIQKTISDFFDDLLDLDEKCLALEEKKKNLLSVNRELQPVDSNKIPQNHNENINFNISNSTNKRRKVLIQIPADNQQEYNKTTPEVAVGSSENLGVSILDRVKEIDNFLQTSSEEFKNIDKTFVRIQGLVELNDLTKVEEDVKKIEQSKKSLDSLKNRYSALLGNDSEN